MAVAERALRELNAKPVCVFMLERGPPHLPLLSELGMETLRKDRERFITDWNPMVAQMAAGGSEQGLHAAEMWLHDIFLENDTREVGWHMFDCPIVALGADWTLDFLPVNTLPKDIEQLIRASPRELLPSDFMSNLFLRQIPLRTRRPILEDGTIFMGQFTVDEFKEWSKWTDHPDGSSFFICKGSDHSTIKASSIARRIIWDTLEKVTKAW